MGTDKTAFGNGGSNRRAAKRDETREARRRERATRQAVDLAAIEPQALFNALECVCRDGGALRIGLSRDGGAFAFGIYGDGEPYTEYVGATEDVNDYLKELARYFDALSG